MDLNEIRDYIITRTKLLTLVLLLTLAAIMSTSAFAAEGIIYGGLSKHLGAESGCNYVEDNQCKEFNEVNPTIGYFKDDLTIIVSELSYNNVGVAGYFTLEPYTSKYIDLGLRVGAVVGYKGTPQDNAIVPLVAPVVEFKYLQHSLELGIMPTGSITVITLNAKYTF